MMYDRSNFARLLAYGSGCLVGSKAVKVTLASANTEKKEPNGGPEVSDQNTINQLIQDDASQVAPDNNPEEEVIQMDSTSTVIEHLNATARQEVSGASPGRKQVSLGGTRDGEVQIQNENISKKRTGNYAHQNFKVADGVALDKELRKGFRLTEGCKVQLQGIKSRPVLNGLYGRIIKQLKNGRWSVKIDKKQHMAPEARKYCKDFKPKYQASFTADKLKTPENDNISSGSVAKKAGMLNEEAADENKKWSCAVCTFFNEKSSTSCTMCGIRKEYDDDEKLSTGINILNDVRNAFKNEKSSEAIWKHMSNALGSADYSLSEQENFMKTTTLNMVENGVRMNFQTNRSMNYRDDAFHSALYFGSELGRLTLVQMLVQHTNVDVNYVDQMGSSGFTSLMIASKNGHHKIVQTLLGHTAINVNQATAADGITALMHACDCGREDITRLLLDHKNIDVNQKVAKGYSPLMIAVVKQKGVSVRQLLGHKDIDVNYVHPAEGASALMLSLGLGDDAIGKMLLDHKGIDVNQTNLDGVSLLHRAVANEKIELVRKFVAHDKIKINYTDPIHGASALMIACQKGSISYENNQIVTELLEHPSIEVNTANAQGVSSLFVAYDNGYTEIVILLLAHMAIDVNLGEGLLNVVYRKGDRRMITNLLRRPDTDVNRVTKDGSSVLIMACERNDFDVVEKLLNRAETKVNQTDTSSAAALHAASQNGYHQIVEKLLSHPNIQVNQRTRSRETALMYAAQGNHSKVVYALLNVAGIDVNETDSSGRTALFKASENGHCEVVQQFLDHKDTNVNQTDNYGFTAFKVALQNNHSEVVKLFRLHPDVTTENFEAVQSSIPLPDMRHLGMHDDQASTQHNDEIDDFGSDTGEVTDIDFLTESGRGDLADGVERLADLENVEDSVQGYASSIGDLDDNSTENGNDTISLATTDSCPPINLPKKDAGHDDFWDPEQEAASVSESEIHQPWQSEGDLVEGIPATEPVMSVSEKISRLRFYSASGFWDALHKLLLDLEPEFEKDEAFRTQILLKNLLIACTKGQVDIVKKLLDCTSISVNAHHLQSQPPLITACKAGQCQVVETLLDYPGIDVNQRDSGGHTALLYVASRGHAELAEKLLNRKDIDVNYVGAVTSGKDFSALQMASQCGHAKIVKNLLACDGIDVNRSGRDGDTPLIIAADQGHSKVIENLLKHPNINVNQAYGDDETALSAACKLGHSEAVQKLLDHKSIDVNQPRSSDGSTLLIRCCFCYASKLDLNRLILQREQAIKDSDVLNAEEIQEQIQCLERQGTEAEGQGHHVSEVVQKILGHKNTDVNWRRWSDGMASLHFAGAIGSSDLAGLLLRHKHIDVNVTTSSGVTPLMIAANNKVTKIVRQLLQHPNIDVNQAADYQGTDFHKGPTVDGQTALYCACREGHKRIVQALLEHSKIDVNKSTKNGITPLYVACDFGRSDVLESLLNHQGIVVNMSSDDGDTALGIACKRGHSDAVSILLHHKDTNVNHVPPGGVTALFRACYNEYDRMLPILHELLQHPAIDVNQAYQVSNGPLPQGATGLWMACRQGNIRVAQQLLQHPKIDIQNSDARGITPLMVALQNGRDDIAKLLSDHASRSDDTVDNTSNEDEFIECFREQHSRLRIVATLVEFNDKNQVKTALDTMLRLISNIIQYPDEEKYKTIKKRNKAIRNKILNFRGGLQALLGMGFKENGDVLVFDGVPDELVVFGQIWKSLSDIISTLSTTEQFVSVFNRLLNMSSAAEKAKEGQCMSQDDDGDNNGFESDDDADLQAALELSLLNESKKEDDGVARKLGDDDTEVQAARDLSLLNESKKDDNGVARNVDSDTISLQKNEKMNGAVDGLENEEDVFVPTQAAHQACDVDDGTTKKTTEDELATSVVAEDDIADDVSEIGNVSVAGSSVWSLDSGLSLSRYKVAESQNGSTSAQDREKEIELVMSQAECSRSDAVTALEKHGNDIVEAISALQEISETSGLPNPVPSEEDDKHNSVQPPKPPAEEKKLQDDGHVQKSTEEQDSGLKAE